MDFVKCSKCEPIKNCCDETSFMEHEEHESHELCNKYYTFPARTVKTDSSNPVANTEQLGFVKNGRYNKQSKAAVSQCTNVTSSTYQSIQMPHAMKDQLSNEDTREEIFSSHNAQDEKNLRCPRCGKRMREPRLLPCLHAICSPCVSELMCRPVHNSLRDSRSDNTNNHYYEICPLCDFQLPNADSPIPPPHYPLQHRLVMNAIRSRFANKILCDVCADEVVAVVQCSSCLHNFCLDCGMEHQQQVTLELKPMKHYIRPLWEATKVRRTTLCQQHPTHALRFYCIACQQVTCKECMWSSQHRGHASENAAGAGKRANLQLTKTLQRAKMLLNILLTQYDRNAFSSAAFEEIRNAPISVDHCTTRTAIDEYILEESGNIRNAGLIHSKTNEEHQGAQCDHDHNHDIHQA